MILDDLCTWLDSNSTRLTKASGTSGNLGKAVMLDAGTVPNTFVALYEQAGQGTGYAFSTGPGRAERVFDRPGVQVLSRSTSYATARDLADVVYQLLDGRTMTRMPTTTGTLYLSIEAVSAPFAIGRDANDRYLVSTNYQIVRDA